MISEVTRIEARKNDKKKLAEGRRRLTRVLGTRQALSAQGKHLTKASSIHTYRVSSLDLDLDLGRRRETSFP